MRAQAYDGEEVLLAYDADFQFGQNFVICLTEAAKAVFLKVKATWWRLNYGFKRILSRQARLKPQRQRHRCQAAWVVWASQFRPAAFLLLPNEEVLSLGFPLAARKRLKQSSAFPPSNE
jgi:hypothetical protein